MRILLIKTSSMGDVIHTFPALSDAARALPALRVDWLVEEEFAALVALHPAVERTLPIALRRWRHQLSRLSSYTEFIACLYGLGRTRYDAVIDAQGLLKSAIPALFTRGQRVGYDRDSIREPAAALLYQRRLPVSRGQHAVTRVRELLSQALNYPLDRARLDYGLRPGTVGRSATAQAPSAPYAVFIHGSSWPSKQWPARHWVAATRLAQAAGIEVCFPQADDAEQHFVRDICKRAGHGRVLPRMTLSELSGVLREASLFIGVDTGLSHLATALDVPGVVVYGASASELTGVMGRHQQALPMQLDCAPCLRRECTREFRLDERPCYLELPPDQVWERALQQWRLRTPDTVTQTPANAS